MNRPTLFVLIILNTLFVTILAVEWYSKTESTTFEKKQTRSENTETEALPTLDLTETSEESYSDLIERPMFIKGRKPVNEPEPENTPVAEVKRVDTFVWNLTGIFTASKGITAFLSRTNAKIEKDNYRKINVGDDLDGWKMAEIHSDKVILTQAGETKTLLLRKAKPKNAPINPISPPQPQDQPKIKIPQGTPIQPLQVPAATQNPDDLSEETVNPENQ
jgi:hypothetical protein